MGSVPLSCAGTAVPHEAVCGAGKINRVCEKGRPPDPPGQHAEPGGEGSQDAQAQRPGDAAVAVLVKQVPVLAQGRSSVDSTTVNALHAIRCRICFQHSTRRQRQQSKLGVQAQY